MASEKFTSQSLSFNRKMVRASASVTRKKNSIHSVTEVDITIPRELIKRHKEQSGEKLSFTAYIVTCFAQVIRQHPRLNSFIKGNRLVILKDVSISVMIEREFNGEAVPEPMVIKKAQDKTYRQINDEVRNAGKQEYHRMGESSKAAWIRFIPGFLLKTFIKLADRSKKMAAKYGKVAVTAVGMFSKEPVWFIPHGTATVLVTVGSIVKRVVEVNGQFESREHLCLSVSFDHDIIDGAPAARFMNQFIETIKDGGLIMNLKK